MGRRSTLDKLPAELRDLFHRLVRDGRTIPEITEKLRELDADVSQSAVGRSVKAVREQMKQYRAAQEMSRAWVQELGEHPEGDVGVLLAEMLKSIAFSQMSQMGAASMEVDGKPAKPHKPMDLMLLAKMIKDLESTAKQSIERREKIEKLVLEKAAKTMRDVGTRRGVSQDTIAEIEKELGLL